MTFAELVRELAHLGVALARRHVVRVEVLDEAARAGRAAVAEPLLGVERGDVAVGRGDLHVGRHAAVAHVAKAEPGAVVEVGVRADVGIRDRRELARAELGAVSGEPRGHQRRTRVIAGLAAVDGRARQCGLRGRALDREVAPGDVLPVVGALCTDRAGDRLLALLGAGGGQRGLGGLFLGDRRVALSAQRVDVGLRLQDLDGVIALRLEERLLLVGDHCAGQDPAAGSVDEAVVEVGPLGLELFHRRLARQLELHDRLTIVRECRTWQYGHNSRDRGCTHPWLQSHSLRLIALGTPPNGAPILRDP